MITSNSRYATSTITRIADASGAVRNTIIIAAPTQRVINFTYYRIVDGDLIQAIATKALGDPSLWWKIADVNPEILSWHSLVAGTIIRIPS